MKKTLLYSAALALLLQGPAVLAAEQADTISATDNPEASLELPKDEDAPAVSENVDANDADAEVDAEVSEENAEESADEEVSEEKEETVVKAEKAEEKEEEKELDQEAPLVTKGYEDKADAIRQAEEFVHNINGYIITQAADGKWYITLTTAEGKTEGQGEDQKELDQKEIDDALGKEESSDVEVSEVVAPAKPAGKELPNTGEVASMTALFAGLLGSTGLGTVFINRRRQNK
ncbi:LPXTG cell wall anchor domain-containing protein [Dolosicoccus paucivorans]|uniref:LPXTG cell wall anchor domain-containing protein n=1 Tax=Dolosicoccus paucivorans TaxID=84521 RepID=UPI00088FE740|nr:LPXTG cell wall anchor domain-containing protein [Dolosicoccus paucivorans]SDI98064.1 LPXTG-motif cell wall anchor domain-containing protein [Dolosicoccus paucivorans]